MMVISGDFTNIIASNTQPKAENKRSAQSNQSSDTSFDDILHKNQGGRSATLKEGNRQPASVASDKSYSDKVYSDKAYSDKAYSDKFYADKVANDKASADKIANDKGATDKAVNDKVRLNEVTKQNASRTKDSVSGQPQKQQENTKTPVHHDQDSGDDQSSSTIHEILKHLDEQKTGSSKENGAASSNSKSDEKSDQSGLNGTVSKDRLHLSRDKNGKSDDGDGSQAENTGNSSSLDVNQLATVNHVVVNQNNYTKAAHPLGGDKTKGDMQQPEAIDAVVDSPENAVGQASKSAKDGKLTAVQTNSNKNGVQAETAQISGAEKDAKKAFGKIANDDKVADERAIKAAGEDNRGQSGLTLEDDNNASSRSEDGDAKVAAGRADHTMASRKQNGVRRTQNNVNQMSNNASQQANFDDAAEKAQASSTLNIGDRVATTDSRGGDQTQAGRIVGVEVTENRQVGDMRLLRIKLNPENLGMVEARLRKTSDGLHIEIHAERQETARLLAADHHALHKALEKSGFNDDGHLTIMIVDRSSQTVQQGQSSNSGQSPSQQDNSGQNFNGQRQFSGQQGQGGHNGSRQAFTEFPVTGTPLQEEGGREETTVRDPRHLVV
ncbi:flagellar hook-length control protein FliK [uncultured Bartonella sp.]|uniref:flagellar hook-length control protein FliK n=1 Tax=uncultured Bartonella sp. TaxID=104108 RepID=UPI0025E8FAC8|nr:flagellar hook-length control protein FliK [uncultured Bartonella sp.]